MEILNIITAVSRPDNIVLLKDNIIKETMGYFNVKWYCIYDIGKPLEHTKIPSDDWIIWGWGGVANDCSGGSQRNVALDLIEKGWICFLDDDNLLYPDFGKIASRTISENIDKQGFIFNQDHKNKINEPYQELSNHNNLIACKENIKLGGIDTAQFIFNRSIIKDIRFIHYLYQSDYFFVKKIYDNNKDNIHFVNEYLSYYNYLRK